MTTRCSIDPDDQPLPRTGSARRTPAPTRDEPPPRKTPRSGEMREKRVFVQHFTYYTCIRYRGDDVLVAAVDGGSAGRRPSRRCGEAMPSDGFLAVDRPGTRCCGRRQASSRQVRRSC
jgi:hypothetical protein